MTILASDSFARANQALWGTGTDGVSVWSHPVGTDTLSVSSNEGEVTYSAGVNNVMFLGTTTQGNIEGRARFQSSDASGSQAGVVLRSNGAGTTFYCLVYKFAAQKLALQRVTAGVATTLSLSAFTADTAHVYRLRFRVRDVAPVHLSGRIWQEGTTEPTAWNCNTLDNSASKITAAGQFGLSALPGIAASTVGFDTVNFGDMLLGTYQDHSTLQARVLTPQEYTLLGGVITTRSGPTAFLAEDFLCKNFSGVWVVPHATFMAHGWERISDPDGLGFYIYSKLGGNRTVVVTDDGNGTVDCDDGTIADTATFDAAYTSL